jgi:hypothetical protein
MAKVIQAMLLANMGTFSFEQVDAMSLDQVKQLADENVAAIASSIWKTSLTEEIVAGLNTVSESLEEIRFRYDHNKSNDNQQPDPERAERPPHDNDHENEDDDDDEEEEDLDFGNHQEHNAISITTTDLISLHKLLQLLFMPQLAQDDEQFDCDRSIKSWLTRFLIVNSLSPKYDRDNERVFIGVTRVTQQLSRLQYWIRGCVLMEIAETLWNSQATRKTVK